MLIFCKKIVFVFTTLTLVACGHLPPLTESSVPLISNHQVSQFLALPNEINTALNQRRGGIMRYAGKTYTLGQVYFSALGIPCALIKERAIRESAFTVCQIDGQWKKMPSLEASGF